MPLIDFEKLYTLSPYALEKKEKNALYAKELAKLTVFHYAHCKEYQKLLDGFSNSFSAHLASKKNIGKEDLFYLEDVPYIPIRLFKNFELKSVEDEAVVKIMTSSGTSGQKVSKIFLDKENITNQTQVLTHILSSYLGKERLPLMFLDTEIVKKDRKMFSARGAGIIGFTPYGRNTLFALNDDMSPNFDKILEFFEKFKNEKVLVFGYTSIIWQHIVKEFEKNNIKYDFKNVVLFHIGGWKKLKDEAVNALEYNRRIKNCFGNVDVYNYYGMAEQLGSVFVECEHAHMHCSNFSNVLTRRTSDFSLCEQGEKGVIQLISLLPTSYPGHSILTEDEGIILGEDDCKCGRKGKYFKIVGRVKKAEIRGCSDTYEHKK